ncbi:hypothetical protein SAMN02745945_00552 [Peptoclostridium litorale DSM 5388]|uniref:Uncharacterized protein n=1 Tax=Peptoclostridium litorale DSM 5388 TaxID=1121324 RepID=A0A069RFX1_PEPLI|nr:hypothetical protein [Peptoclostridium litorale]KDR95080.1 hypothetical protein CLIT_11c01090 [Peptoclostridium litorale DSM 5388]SIN75347.1 hypothetical protein SAMN02745945_00552 [Peptoclostridium litorale DSM 5388]
MEEILWIIALIAIRALFGRNKKEGEKRATARKQRTSGQIGVPAKATIKEQKRAKPKKTSIESYFKDMAQEIKKQQDVLAQKTKQAQRERKDAKADVQPFESIEEPVVKVDKKASGAQRESAYYFEEKEHEKKKTYEIVHAAEEAAVKGPFESLFESPNEIVKGIIYSEVLSKPKSLRKN